MLRMWLGRDILVVCLTSLCILVKLSVLNRRRKLKYNELFKTCLIVFIGHKSREQRHRDRPYALPPRPPFSKYPMCPQDTKYPRDLLRSAKLNFDFHHTHCFFNSSIYINNTINIYIDIYINNNIKIYLTSFISIYINTLTF